MANSLAGGLSFAVHHISSRPEFGGMLSTACSQCIDERNHTEARIMCAAFSAIIVVGAFVFPVVISGMIDELETMG